MNGFSIKLKETFDAAKTIVIVAIEDNMNPVILMLGMFFSK